MASSPPRWCVFFDRDGTLNAHVVRDGRRSSPRDPSEWHPLPGALRALERLRRAGARLAVVTNQPDLSRGLLSRHTLSVLHRLLGPVDAVYVCPHTAADRCRCRKPSSHWLHVAARRMSVSLPHSYFVGDRPTDAQAALNAGVTAVVVVPRDHQHSLLASVRYARDLDAAVAAILSHRASTTSKPKGAPSWNSAPSSIRPARSAT